MKIAVFITHPDISMWHFSPQNTQRLQTGCPQAEIVVCRDSESFKSALADAEIALTWVFKEEWFGLARRLRWLVTPAAGREYLKSKPPPGVRLVFGSFHGKLIAETVLGMMLGHCRGLFSALRMQDQAWPRATLAAHMTPLRETHAVILGFGHVGQWVARMAKPFGVRITGIRRTVTPAIADREPDLGSSAHIEQWLDANDVIRPMSELDAVLPTADHLILVLPGDASTNHLINAQRLALLPQHAVIYNVGRGNSIDESALVDALHNHRLAAAYLDVFAQEPLPADSPLRRCHNIFLLPHLSAAAPTYLDHFIDELAARIRLEW